MCVESRTDSLAARLKRLDLFDEYFAWWLFQRPSFKERMEWMEEHDCACSEGALSRLQRSPEAGVWRKAEAARGRKVMDENLPKDIDETIRKALLDARFNEVLGEISHDMLMDHLKVEHDAATLALKARAQKLKEQVEPKKLKIAGRRVKLLEQKVTQATGVLGDKTLSDSERTIRMKQIFGISA